MKTSKCSLFCFLKNGNNEYGRYDYRQTNILKKKSGRKKTNKLNDFILLSIILNENIC